MSNNDSGQICSVVSGFAIALSVMGMVFGHVGGTIGLGLLAIYLLIRSIDLRNRP